MTTTQNLNAGKIHDSLTRAEVNGDLAPDCRRVLREERFAVASAMRSGDKATIAAACREAIRVAEMWGVRL